jgi:hypothetical protein
MPFLHNSLIVSAVKWWQKLPCSCQPFPGTGHHGPAEPRRFREKLNSHGTTTVLGDLCDGEFPGKETPPRQRRRIKGVY